MQRVVIKPLSHAKSQVLIPRNQEANMFNCKAVQFKGKDFWKKYDLIIS